MKISVISDLHCRNKSFPTSFDAKSMQPADVLVVAGDLATHVNYDKLVDKLSEEVKDKFKRIIFVKGNHDYYVTDPHWLHHHQPPVGPTGNDNEVVSFDDEKIDFICTPLWSPIRNDEYIRDVMNDYNYIPGFTTERCTSLFWGNLDWLEDSVEKSIAKGYRYVIVTHHLPIPELIDPVFAGNDANEAFCVLNEDAEARIRKLKPALWIHGHSHNFVDMTVDDVRYVRNPYGYEWLSHDYDGSSKEKTGYRPNFIVEI